MQVDLTSPIYREGVLQTENGGIIRGKGFYMQAKQIRYVSQNAEGDDVSLVQASGNLFVRLDDRIYVGDRIEFDLDSLTGTIYNVMTESGPWFIEGKKLIMHSDGSSIIHDCILSMNENDWAIQASEVNLSKNATLKAKNVRFLVMKQPVMYVPSYTKDLKDTTTPIKYRLDYNRKHGPRLGLSYTNKYFENWENRFLFDISLKRGLAGGFETSYKNKEHPAEQFSAFNYYAYDITTIDSNLKNRYRFQGKYTNKYLDDSINLKATYDRLSDINFPSDYSGKGFDSGRAGPTQVQLSKHTSDWIAKLNTKVRINNFQTVKQTLPLFEASLRPVTLGGVVVDNRLSVGYLNYLYAHKTPDVYNFHSGRAELSQKAFRNFASDAFVFTPYVGYRAIGYSNSPQHESRLLAIGQTGFDLHTRFQRESEGLSHVVEPYLQYDYVTKPTVNPPKHFLFDLQDGLYRQNTARFGARNFIRFAPLGTFRPQMNFDLYARYFFHSPHIVEPIPRVYFDAKLLPTDRLQFSLQSAWHTQTHSIDHFNLRSDITVTENLALALEFRHRDKYAWRKTDPENFMLDTYRKQHELLHSQVSDRRNTFLTHIFWRPMPSFALEARSRTCWGRRDAKSFNEYELNGYFLVRQAFQVAVGYEKLKEGYRLHFGFSLGQSPPKTGYPSFTRIGQGSYNIP